MDIKRVRIDEIKEYQKNTKEHPEDQINKIANSIKEFGFNVPIILTKDNMIIAGHGRLLAAKKLGLKEIPSIYKENLTEEQITAYRIADNKTAESDWNFDFLKEEFEDLQEKEYNLELTGFDNEKIEETLQDKEIVRDYSEKEFDENIETNNECPKCQYRW